MIDVGELRRALITPPGLYCNLCGTRASFPMDRDAPVCSQCAQEALPALLDRMATLEKVAAAARTVATSTGLPSPAIEDLDEAIADLDDLDAGAATECSICRRVHGREVVHPCE